MSYIGTILPMAAPSDMPNTPETQAEPAGQSDLFSQTGLPRRFGRYLLLRMIARGGMGQVFLASTMGVEGAERPVVVKVIRREYAKDPNFLARFLDEARVQAQLSHSGVAQVLEAAEHEPTDDPYVVLEYVEGRSLGNLRQRATDVGLRLGWEDAVAIAALVTEALAYVHERRDHAGRPLGIVHRDLSPHNVMVGYSGEIKIIDFGTARGQNRRCHTVSGVVFAKPGYVAPEVANGDRGDARVDLYAAGVMLWELCAGRRFLQGEPARHLAAVARGDRDLPAIASLVGAPKELDEVIARLTAHDRDHRFESSRSAAAQLARLLSSSEPLPNGERGVRARVAQLMYNLYPSEPARSRRRFAKLVAAGRDCDESWEAPPAEPACPGAAEPAAESEPPAPAAPSAEPEPEPEPAIEAPEDLFEMLRGTRYHIRKELGRGASSVVYEAEDVELGRRVAVKVLSAEHTDSRDFAARFRKEARALSRLSHPGLVRVHDFGQTDDGKLFYVMELLEGQTLRRLLDASESYSWREALRITHRCCQALQAAHDAGIVHRDIKPGNIFLSEAGHTKLLDFGLAKTAEEVLGEVIPAHPQSSSGDPAAERLGALTLYGTPEYMAPEQVAGSRIDERADLYSLGCVLYELLTGRQPFVAESAVGLLDAKLKGSPEGVAERAKNRRIPRNVDRLVLTALARHPSRRFRSAMEMARAIEGVLDAPTLRRNRRRVAGSAVAAAIMAFGAVLVGIQAAPQLGELPAQIPWVKQRPHRPQPAHSWPAAPADWGERSLVPEPAPEAPAPPSSRPAPAPQPDPPPTARPKAEPVHASTDAPAAEGEEGASSHAAHDSVSEQDGDQPSAAGDEANEGATEEVATERASTAETLEAVGEGDEAVVAAAESDDDFEL